VRSVIAFLSDFGLRDSYVGIVKGVLASLVQDPFIIDITHDVPPHDILRGAYILGCSHTFFPVGTVFLCVVDPGVGTERAGLVVCVGDRVFVAPDNGLLSEIFHRCKGWKAYRIETERFAAMPRLSSTFHARDVFAPVAARIACGMDPSESGPSHLHPVILDLPVPNEGKGCPWWGKSFTMIGYGNLITNLDYQEVTFFSRRPCRCCGGGRCDLSHRADVFRCASRVSSCPDGQRRPSRGGRLRRERPPCPGLGEGVKGFAAPKMRFP